MNIWILTLISLVYNTDADITEFDKSYMANIPSSSHSGTESFIISSREFNKLYGRLLSTQENSNVIENECPICLNLLVNKESDEMLTILVHDESKRAPHCFHFNCIRSITLDSNPRCPMCREKFKINSDQIARISVENILRMDLENLTEEGKVKILRTLSNMYWGNKSVISIAFFNEKFTEGILKDIIFNDKSPRNAGLREILKNVITMKKGLEESNIDNFMTSWRSLLISTRGNHKVIDFLKEAITKKEISSKIKSLDLSNGCVTSDNLNSLIDIINKLENLESLNLSYNYLNNSLAISLIDTLKGCRNLRSLNLSHNRFGSDGMNQLLNSLEMCEKLTVLNLFCNGLNEVSLAKKSLNRLFKADLKSFTEEVKKDAISLISSICYHYRDGIMIVFLNKKFTPSDLENIIDNKGPSSSFDSPKILTNIMMVKKGAKEIGINEFIKCWTDLLRSSDCDSRVIDHLVDIISSEKDVLSEMKSLDLSNRDINTNNVESFIRLFNVLENIESLDISRCGIDAKLMKLLAGAMKGWKNLTSLNISSNQIEDEEMNILAEVLKVHSNLTILNVSNNKIGVEGMKALAEALKVHKNLTVLNVAYNLDVEAEGMKALAEVLKVHSNLTMLNVSSNQIGVEGMKALAEALKLHSNLTTLDVSDIRDLGVEGINALAEILKAHKNLMVLRISNNHIGDEGVIILSGAIKGHRNLTELRLQWNEIGNEGIKAFANAAKESKTLKYLDISDNHEISDEGAIALEEAMKQWKDLEWLNTGFNKISDVGTAKLIDAVGEKLKYFKIPDYCNLGDIGKEALRRLIERRRDIRIC